MSNYHCSSCNKGVMYKNRGFLYFIFWPYTIYFMKKRCPICASLVTNHNCGSCKKKVMYKDRGFLYFLFWPWTIMFMKKKCSKCGTEVITT